MTTVVTIRRGVIRGALDRKYWLILLDCSYINNHDVYSELRADCRDTAHTTNDIKLKQLT